MSYHTHTHGNDWGIRYNAAQFTQQPYQNRNRIIGGRFVKPATFHAYRKTFKGVCPCVTATEWKGCATDPRRASNFYKRKLTLTECAYHQGFEVPSGWSQPLPEFTRAQWLNRQYQAIGNGVPVYMAYAFGVALKRFLTEGIAENGIHTSPQCFTQAPATAAAHTSDASAL